ncbi:MAG: hypothetical protein E3J60_04545 [Dehalococcoidia bacterium]|nr:MAG: hypothetical protein E3J60_04545 [Dehalococcoidia bacterium]
MNIEEAYLVMQEHCGIEVGDKVRVIRKHSNFEMGYGCQTSKGKETLVGETGIVESVNKHSNSIRIGFKGGLSSWGFPFFCLELVEKAKPELPPIKVGGREVIFGDGCIKVCGLLVTKPILHEILDRLEK